MNDIGYGGKGAESSIPVQTEKEIIRIMVGKGDEMKAL